MPVLIGVEWFELKPLRQGSPASTTGSRPPGSSICY